MGQSHSQWHNPLLDDAPTSITVLLTLEKAHNVAWDDVIHPHGSETGSGAQKSSQVCPKEHPGQREKKPIGSHSP